MNKIHEILTQKERNCFKFQPNKTFYEVVEINRKRWGQIYRGEVDPTISEAKSIANYFEFDVTELI